MTYVCMVFRHNLFYRTEGNTHEDALEKMQDAMCGTTFSSAARFVAPHLTYRPADGTVYVDGHHVPCGVIFVSGGPS